MQANRFSGNKSLDQCTYAGGKVCRVGADDEQKPP